MSQHQRLLPLAIAVILPLLFLNLAYAQTKNVELVGRVSDEKTGDPLPGAVIHIKGTTHEVLSDNNGEFKFITGQRVPVTYIVTYVGYKAKEIEVDNYDHAELKLQGVNAQLNDVVVVGYGTQRRSDVTGAVAAEIGRAHV